jgi:hypothetical protein
MCFLASRLTLVIEYSDFVADMGQNPIWTNSHNRLFHFNFDVENDKEDYILIEIYNRDQCIGNSKYVSLNN